MLDAPAFRESVRQDLSRLLNTRASLRGSVLQIAEGTVLDYGLPDLSSLTPASESDRTALAKAVAARISTHEPRLRNVRVIIGPDPASPRSVQGVITASLVMGQIYEPVTFHLSMELGSKSPAAALT
jgi:type VI secretion system protein ImpF